MKIFYHDDTDGRCAAHVIGNQTYPIMSMDHSKYIAMDYNRPFPFDKVVKDESVYIVDYSISTEDMDKLFDITKNVVWIDHHQSSLEKYKGYDKKISGIRYNGLAGCVLTWIYMKYGSVTQPSQYEWEVPEYIRLLGDYDTWTFKYGDRSLHFYFGMQSEDTGPESRLWMDVKASKYLVDKLVGNGQIICKYRNQLYREMLATYGYKTTFEGHKAIVLNAEANSNAFDSVAGKYDLNILVVWNGEVWTVSLYSKIVDVAKLAEKYGGGGHVQASGFATKELPWSKS